MNRKRLKDMKLAPVEHGNPEARACTTKVWFPSLRDASYGTTKQVYKCPHCGGFHRTSKPL